MLDEFFEWHNLPDFKTMNETKFIKGALLAVCSSSHLKVDSSFANAKLSARKSYIIAFLSPIMDLTYVI